VSVISNALVWAVLIGSLDYYSEHILGALDRAAQADIAAESRLFLLKMFLLNIALLMILFGVILLVTRRISFNISEPIVELAGAVSNYKDGAALNVPIRSEDEVGTLARKFITMADTIANLRDTLENFKGRLSAVTDNIDTPSGAAAPEKMQNGKEFKTALAGLQELNNSADEVLALVRHELKTPLTSIIASAEALLSDLPFTEEKKSTFIYIIQDEAHRLTRLINDLMDFSRLEGTDAPVRKNALNLPELIRHVVLANKPLSESKNISVEILPMADDERLTRVMADRDRIIQLLTNILDNANKYTPRGGRVAISLETIERKPKGVVRRFARVAIKDTGIGIDPRQRKKVFEKYGQLKTIQQQPEGMGLGMAIAKWIVRAHGGKIWFTSRPGAGTTFYFTLPLDGSAAPSAR
jgi:two-component system, NarL family, sensor histidine kinase BarA